MLDKDSFPVFAQYHEDIILAALLYKVDKGFYVDVGANEETKHSVTKYFYHRGWSGINVEPIARLFNILQKNRPRDINIQVALSSEKGKLKFREYPDYDGFSTLRPNHKESKDQNLPYKDYDVKTDRLDNVLKQHNVKQIDFLKIDVEGFEFEVLKGNDWNKYRPTVICIESNHMESDWSKYLTDRDYVKFIFDGLNEYYISKESINITDGFASRAAIFAHNAIRDHHFTNHKEDLKRIKFLEEFATKQDQQIKNTTASLEALQQQLPEVRKLSLKDKGYKGRLKATVKGLTTDYYKHKLGR